MFNQLAGNQSVKELIIRMLESKRVPGALLFSGEEGIGKKHFAIELAKALNCRTPKGAEACDQCPANRSSYFDTKIRDAAHLAQAIRYVERNPTKARLVRDPRDWPWSSARLRDEYHRLPWQRDAASGA